MHDRLGRPGQRRGGFTLIELLVVIAVIAVLLAVLMPALRRAKEQGRQAVCQSNLRNVAIALMLYANDNNYALADCNTTNGFLWFDSTRHYRTTSDPDAYWAVAYITYMKETKVCGCPSFRNVAELIYPGDPKRIWEAAFGLNSNLSRKKVTAFKNTSQFIICHDHVEPKMEQGSTDMFYNDGPGTLNLKAYRTGGARARFYPGIFRHSPRSSNAQKTGGRANMLWLDAHVSALAETTGDDVPSRWYTGARR